MRRDAGSIFLDTMIAAAIVSMSLAMMYRVIIDTTRRDGAVEDKRMAALVAQSELAAVGYEIPIEPAGARGTAGGYVWRVAMAPWNGGIAQGSAGRLWLVTVSVAHPNGADLVSLQTLRLVPGT